MKDQSSNFLLFEEIQNRLLERLEFMKIVPKKILNLGVQANPAAGLKKYYPSAEIIHVDCASQRLKKLKKFFWRRSQRVLGTSLQLPFKDNSVDLVFSNGFLQSGDSILASIEELQRILRPNGLLLFSSFGPDTLQELKASFSAVDNYAHVHQFLDMHDIGDLMLKNGFVDPVVDMEHITFNYANLDTIFSDIQTNFTKFKSSAMSKGLMTPRKWQRMRANFLQLRREEKIPVTFEIIYGQAWKGGKARDKSDEFIIQVGSIEGLRGLGIGD